MFPKMLFGNHLLKDRTVGKSECSESPFRLLGLLEIPSMMNMVFSFRSDENWGTLKSFLHDLEFFGIIRLTNGHVMAIC